MNKEKWTKRFDEKFPCIQRGCDGNGTIANCVGEDEWEQQQCQYCDEQRLPYKDFIQQELDTQRKKIEELNKRFHGIGLAELEVFKDLWRKEIVEEINRLSKNNVKVDLFGDGYDRALTDILNKLK